MYSDPELKNEIVLKRDYIKKKKKDMYSTIEKLFNGALEREALEHSLRIEYPLVNSLSKKELINTINKEEFHILSQGLKSAWDYGKSNFKMPINDEFVLQLAYIIDSRNFPNGLGYRDVAVRPTNASVTPPYPAKLPIALSRFHDEINVLYDLNTSKNKTATQNDCFDIGAAIHLGIARVHPFEDGNGRTARLLHNLYLRNMDSYPPIIIYEAERKEYIATLDGATLGYKNRDGDTMIATSRAQLSDGEKKFYDYMATKLNLSLDKVIKE